jgi:hypothetical protein
VLHLDGLQTYSQIFDKDANTLAYFAAASETKANVF